MEVSKALKVDVEMCKHLGIAHVNTPSEALFVHYCN